MQLAKIRKQTLDGNVETLIMAVLAEGPSYGYAIVRDLKKRSQGLLKLGEGTVYPVLYRMEEKGLISSKWISAENGRDRKYYRLVAKGKRAFASNTQEWRVLLSIMEKVLGPAGELAARAGVKGATV